jgi:fucose permease
VASVVLMPHAFNFGDKELAASVNLGLVFFALGALMTPTLTDLLLRTLGFRKTVALLALVFLAPAAVAALSWHGVTEPAEKGDLAEVLDNKHVWLAGVAFLFYAPLEFAISTWGTTYLTVDQGYKERRAALTVSLFWLAFLGSRVLMTFLLHRRYLSEEHTPWVVLLLALLASAMLGFLAGGGKAATAGWALVALGFALGPIFPTLVALTLKEAPANRGTAFGAMFAIGSLGSALLAPVLGVLARGQKVLRALRVLAPLGLLLVVAALAILGSWE